jgi:hypothetical protein
VADATRLALAPEAVETWRRRFPGLIPSELVPAERLERATFDLEGHKIVPVDIGHTDTDNTTCLHVPSIGLVIAGDAIYNNTHLYMVESGHQGLRDWLAAIDKIEAGPSMLRKVAWISRSEISSFKVACNRSATTLIDAATPSSSRRIFWLETSPSSAAFLRSS